MLVLLGAMLACGSRDGDRTRLGAKASCHADRDCTVVTQTSCCAACPDSPRGVPVESAELRERQCAATSCTKPSERIECPKVDALQGYVARCDEGTCAAAKPWTLALVRRGPS